MFEVAFGEGVALPQTEKFLKSLGRVAAFNWYCGQGDLNATNVSIYDGECYPFDFDCSFQSIQSEQSFAKMREATFDSVDLDASSDTDGILKGTIDNLKASLEAVIPGVGDTLLPFTTPENLAIIREGFEEQLERVLDVDDEEISGILDKHLSDDEEAREQYEEFLSSKRQSALSMSSTHSSEGSLEDMGNIEEATEVLDTNADAKTYPSEEFKEALEEFKAEARRDDEALDDQEAADSKDGPRQ
ncbi:MAG: hypothetical protein K0U37_04440 [Gammaproteobacteria bacterium]|nr:hypothetical protein [Gammaproteobacteria bacterium]